VSAVARPAGGFLGAAVGGLFAAVGRLVLGQLRVFGEWTALFLSASALLLRGKVSLKELAKQIDEIGVSSIPLAALTVTFSSMVLAIYSVPQFMEYGFHDYVGRLVGESIFREIGPVLTAIVLAAREGSAIAAELGSMKITEQVDALRALAVDPVEYLVVPRFAAALIAVPLVTLVACIAGVIAGWFVAHSYELAYDVYWSSVQRGVELTHYLSGLVKALVFGALIAIVSCHQGLTTGHGAAAVGRSTTASVVLCVLLVHVADFALVLVFGGQ
jgi:phospholipid/cholesterol/gamma-HCH transport system permease protein